MPKKPVIVIETAQKGRKMMKRIALNLDNNCHELLSMRAKMADCDTFPLAFCR